MTRRYDINHAFSYLSGDLATSDRLAYEAALERSPEMQDQLDAARRARDTWSLARADVDSVPAGRWAALDDAVFRAVMQDGSGAHGGAWSAWAPGRVLVWAGVAAAVAVGVYALATSRPATSPAPEVAEAVEAPEVGERGAIYAAGNQVRQVTVAKALVDIQPQGACQITRVEEGVTRLEVLTGAAHFTVDKRQPGEVFEVTAADVVVQVVGTAFTVERLPTGAVRVDVDHGIVAVTRDSEPRATLHAGETITVISSVQMAAVEREEAAHERHHAAPTPVRPRPTVVHLGHGSGDPAGDQPAAERAPATAESATDESATDESATAEPVADAAPRRRAKRRTARRAAPQPAAAVARPAEAVQAEPEQPTAAVEAAAKAAPVVAEPESVKAGKAEKDVEPAEAGTADTGTGDTATKVERAPTDEAGRELRDILARIGTGNDAAVIGQLKAWRKANPGHRGSLKARYAVGYCLFQLGDRRAAIRIFESVASRKNPWVNTAGDYLNPPRPR